MSDLLAAALGYAARGWHVFPLKPRDKTPLLPGKGAQGGHKAATLDPEQIKAWWSTHPDANIGISLEPSNLVVHTRCLGVQGVLAPRVGVVLVHAAAKAQA